MKRRILILVTLLLLFSGCGLKRTISMYETRQPYYGEITVVSLGQPIPSGYKMIGTGSYGEKGLTRTDDCTLEAIINQARTDAKEKGASLISIMKIKEPSILLSTCYQVTISFYISDNQ
ncbi:MAG: hypothetical protein J6R59_05170 [Paludibacteraceae bacterium]|nr:hypothetical protein [Paludibacteraceae bacterium]